MSIQIPRTPCVLTEYGVTRFPVAIRKRSGLKSRCAVCEREVTDGNVVGVIRKNGPNLLLHEACTPAEVFEGAKG